jgi:hypothetical protein
LETCPTQEPDTATGLVYEADPGTVARRGGKPYPDVSDVQRANGVAWGQLVELKPQLETLLWLARTAGGNCRNFLDVDRAFGPLRDELAGLIGFAGKHYRHPVLGSARAYEVAYWKLYDAVAALLPAQRAETAPAPGAVAEGAPGAMVDRGR